MVKKRKILLITGLSGAGKTTILKILEDINYYTIDNIPPHLIEEFLIMLLNSSDIDNIAFVSDIRWKNPKELKKEILKIRKRFKYTDITFKVIFLDSSIETIKIRFMKSRRGHPLQNSNLTLDESIDKEIELMNPIKEISDIVVDTTNLEPSKFREKIFEILDEQKENNTKIKIISFGFKYSSPNDLDYLFDVRFLPNPYYIKELFVQTGKDKEIIDYLEHFEESKEIVNSIFEILIKIQKWYSITGRVSINVGIGCTGGRHRSVYVAEKLYALLKSKNYNVSIYHRDINR
ncbi:RNase adapter RapZ [Marinitoga aeolica]|uniref:RNase adapter RapZ n=1 Tax=Marinitoga aeolica TaxID=2809031 RepID=A0ABY8PNL5_9BACT|nr:RNase adapter RapZ [Marinitoga aeolica]WGS64215.1 RNase adapter RapZ [Marinitoga aeolica]